MNTYLRNLIVLPVISGLLFAALETLLGNSEHLLHEAVLNGLILALILSVAEVFPSLKKK